MTRPRAALSALTVLVIIALGLLWVSSGLGSDEPEQFFRATVTRDCAPWDGVAFTVSIPWSAGETIALSIYRSPDIKLPVIFSFPDETMRLGNASLIRPDGLPEQLSGRIFFPRVEPGSPVEGRFDLTGEGGELFRGNFKAEWGDQIVYCG